MFSTCGTIISSKVVLDSSTGQSKGSGFVKFSTVDEAQVAIHKLNGEGGILVKFADKDVGQAPRPAAPATGRAPSSNLYVTGLPSPEADQASLHGMFEALGLSVLRSRVIPDTRGTGSSAAMVQLASVEEAGAAIGELQGQVLPGQQHALQLSYASERPAPGAGPVRPARPARPALPAGPAWPALPARPAWPALPAAPALPAPPAGASLPLAVKYAGSGQSPSDNLYISGLPGPQVDQGLLGELFAGLGLTVVRSRVIPDTKGIGSSAAMVQLASQEEAASAIDSLNGQMVQGLTRTATPIGGVRGGHGGREATLAVKYAGGDGSTPSDNLYITGLPSPQVDQAILHQIFAGLELTVVRSKIIPDTRGSGVSAAMVQVASQEEAESAILALNGEFFSAMESASTAMLVSEGSGCTTLRLKYAGGDGSPPSDNLYITGLPSPPPDRTTFNQVFTGLGLTVVRSKIIPDTRGTGISAAMVQLASQEEAEAAIQALDGEQFPAVEYIPSAVSSCASPQQAAAAPALRLKYAGDGSQPSDNLYITGLPSPPPDQETLDQVFAGLGFTVVRSRVIPDTRGSGISAAMVQLASQEEAASAIASLSGEVFPSLDSFAPAGQASSVVPARQEAGGAALWLKYAGDGNQPSNNLYVTGLPSPPPDQATLNQVFVGLGLTVVRSKVIPDTRGRGTSAAMVQLASQEEAASAMEALNGEVFPALESLQPARPSPAAPPQALSSAALKVKYAGDGSQPSDNLYISGLPSPAPEAARLRRVFEGLGLTVVRSKVIPDTRGIGISAAMVQLASPEEAASAIASLNGAVLPPDDSPQPEDRADDAPGVPRSGGAALKVKYAGDGFTPSDNLYISGLPNPAPSQAALNQIFARLGLTVVRSKVIPDTRGYGNSAAMVQLASREEAASAIAALSGVDPSSIDAATAAEPAEEGEEAMAAEPAEEEREEPGEPGEPEEPEEPEEQEAPWSQASRPLVVKYKGDPNVPSDTIYIAGLPSPRVDKAVLHRMFEDQGWTVLWSMVIEDKRGSGSSAAMVQLGSLWETADAIKLWHGQRLPPTEPEAAEAAEATEGDQAMEAAEAAAAHSPLQAWAAAAGVDLQALRPKYAGAGAPSDNLYIAGLPSPELEKEALLELFSGLGLTVVRAKVIPDTRGSGSSAAMVQMASQEQAEAAMAALLHC